MSDGIKVARLAHVGLRARNLGKQAEFYTDRWGLDAIDEHGTDVFLRADGPDHHVLTLHAGDEAGLDHFAFEVDQADDIDRAADIVSGLGLEIVVPPTQDLEPGVARAVRFRDPEGNVVELVSGVDQVRDQYGTRDVKPQALNHVVFRPHVELELSPAGFIATVTYETYRKDELRFLPIRLAAIPQENIVGGRA